GCRIVPETVSRRGLERRRSSDGKDGGHALVLKRRRRECNHHLLRYGFHAERSQSLSLPRRAGSGQIKLELRRKIGSVRLFLALMKVGHDGLRHRIEFLGG